MRDDEIAEVRQRLVELVRGNGWESLFEPMSTPSDIKVRDEGARQEIARLVGGLLDLVDMLPRLEDSIAHNVPGIRMIKFAVDDEATIDDRALVLPVIEKGSLNPAYDRYASLRQTLQILRAEVETID